MVGDTAGVGIDGQQPERRDLLGLALQREAVQRFDRHGVAHELQRLRSQQYLSGRRRLLQARRDVHSITDRDVPPLAAEYRSGVHPRAKAQRDADLLRQRRQALADLRRCANRPKRVVLVYLRDPEPRHHRVADELLHRPAVTLDRRAHVREVAIHDATQRLRIELLPERGGARHVAEQRCDDLSPLLADALAYELRAAGAAEAEVLRTLKSAATADCHTAEHATPRTRVLTARRTRCPPWRRRQGVGARSRKRPHWQRQRLRAPGRETRCTETAVPACTALRTGRSASGLPAPAPRCA